jgi:hypothetical protein
MVFVGAALLVSAFLAGSWTLAGERERGSSKDEGRTSESRRDGDHNEKGDRQGGKEAKASEESRKFKLTIEVLRKDRAGQSFNVDVNDTVVNTDKEGKVTLQDLPGGTTIVKPVTPGFIYEPQERIFYLKYRPSVKVRFYAVPGGSVPLPVPKVVVSPLTLSVPEGGSTQLYVSLDADPGADVTIALLYTGDPDIIFSQTNLTFTSFNWREPQMITVSAAVDADTANGAGIISLSAPQVQKAEVAVVEKDRDAPPVVVLGSHANRIAGLDPKKVTQTCLKCHLTEALEVWGSVHYQWLGEGRGETDIGVPAGKITGINDFCIYVGNTDANWIGKMVNLDGIQVDGGCAKCHAGLGARPDPHSNDRLQLENIDCLVCHSPNYKRKVMEIASGMFRFVPDEAAMGISIQEAAADIQALSKAQCLQCHAKAGGGNNYKRGDLELAHLNPTKAFDVHMGVDGQNFGCTTCHFVEKHRFAGRGIDLRPVDILGAKVTCENCHTASPHRDNDLDRHALKVFCTVCHNPTFAKVAPTDMFRDWSKPGVITAERLYEPWIEFRSNVQPKYIWWNGTSSFYIVGTPAVPGQSGRLALAAANGDINDPGSRIYATKHHLGNQPVDPVTRSLLPLKASIFFQTGQIEPAVIKGVEAVGWPYNGFGFMPTERHMGIFHEVAPKGEALQCADCHASGATRLDFVKLGYLPRETRNNRQLCSSCHGSKSMPSFERLHDKHVADKRLACAECHFFSRP